MNISNFPSFLSSDRHYTDPELMNVVHEQKPVTTYFIQPTFSWTAESIIGGLRMVARIAGFIAQNITMVKAMSDGSAAVVIAQSVSCRLMAATMADGRVAFGFVSRISSEEIGDNVQEQYGVLFDSLQPTSVADIIGASWRQHKERMRREKQTAMELIHQANNGESSICTFGGYGLSSIGDYHYDKPMSYV